MKTMNLKDRLRGRRGRSLFSGLTVVALALTASACDLAVDLPGEVEAADLQGTESLPLLATSAHGVFECAFSQFIFLAAFIVDEIYHSGSRAQLNSYGLRTLGPDHGAFGGSTCPGSQFGALYTPLSQARWMADEVLRRAEKVTEQQLAGVTRVRALTASLAGYSYVIFGEGWCSAAFDSGPELQPPAMFKLAVERFTKAIEEADAAKASDLRNLAHLGRARARLNLGELAAAASDARQVADGFVFNVTRSNSDVDRWNSIFHHNAELGEIQGHPNYWNLRFQGVADPRVQVVVTGGLSRLATPEALIRKYTALSSSFPLARHTEALLIIAEAEGGQTAVDIINRLHTRVGLPAFASTDQAEIVKQVREERRRELYLESHRIGDMRRLKIPFYKGAHPFIKGRFYGDTECFPLPDIERLNNPNLRPRT